MHILIINTIAGGCDRLEALLEREDLTRIDAVLLFFSVETEAQGVLQATAALIATGARPRLLNVPGAHRLIDPGMS